MEDEEYTTAVQDLALIIAAEKSGLKNAVPNKDDFQLAHKFVEMIKASEAQRGLILALTF